MQNLSPKSFANSTVDKQALLSHLCDVKWNYSLNLEDVHLKKQKINKKGTDKIENLQWKQNIRTELSHSGRS